MVFSEDDYMFTSQAGVRWYVRVEGDYTYIGSSQDPTPILEHNLKTQNMSDGWSPDKTFRHAASIPYGVVELWKSEGVDINDENNAREVIRRLNSSENHKLRSSLWNI